MQGRLVAGAADDLHGQGHAVGGDAGGDRHRRVAEVVPGHAEGIDAAHAEHGPDRAAALPAAHRNRRVAHHRGDQHVEGVEDRVDPGGVDLAGRERPLEEAVGDQASQPGEAAGAPFEPLGVGHLGELFGDAAQVARRDVVADAAPGGVLAGRPRGRASAAARPSPPRRPWPHRRRSAARPRAVPRLTRRHAACRARSGRPRQRGARAVAALRARWSRR